MSLQPVKSLQLVLDRQYIDLVQAIGYSQSCPSSVKCKTRNITLTDPSLHRLILWTHRVKQFDISISSTCCYMVTLWRCRYTLAALIMSLYFMHDLSWWQTDTSHRSVHASTVTHGGNLCAYQITRGRRYDVYCTGKHISMQMSQCHPIVAVTLCTL